jgi:hypothetical protein
MPPLRTARSGNRSDYVGRTRTLRAIAGKAAARWWITTISSAAPPTARVIRIDVPSGDTSNAASEIVVAGLDCSQRQALNHGDGLAGQELARLRRCRAELFRHEIHPEPCGE